MRMKLHLYLIVYFVIFILNKHGYGHLIRYYLGCYQSFHHNVVLLNKSSVTSCIEACKTQSQMSTFAALKNGNECYCGNDFRTSTQERNCQKRCEDSSSEFCGGEQHYSVYSICLIGSHGRNCDRQCSNCQNSVPCMRNNGECFSIKCHKTSHEKCDIARFLNDFNVAFNRPAHQSSTYQQFHASLAVDGNNNTNVNDGRTCSHTDNEENPWFYVDFEMERNIKKVIITNREDNDTGNAKRLLHARVSLSNKRPPTPERDLQSCGTVTRLQNIEMTCSSHNKYRYLVVTLQKTEFLTICEIEVYMEDCKSCEGNEECTYVNNNRNRRCTCRSGFFKDNIYSPCTDINECADNSHLCNTTMSACQNHDGGYSCTCKPGYGHTGSDNITCYDVDECRNHKHQCDVTSTTCSNNVGSYVCNCKAGYQYSSAVKCVDIDECRTNHSCNTTTSSCINNVGSYICQCRAGYVNYGNNVKCVDFDECQNNRHSCDTTITTCLNTDGSYRCECKTGYQQDYHHPNKCKDIDECSNTSPCDSTTSTCRNTDGSYRCECKTGYQRRHYHPHGCVDINECDQRKCDASSTTCENVIGSFKCHCKPGFKMLNSTSCSDVDECEGNNHNCDLSTTTCTNYEGYFRCDCKVGFEKINSNNTSCKDIDECSRNVCDGKSTNCQNNIGSYLCHCKDGYSRLHQNKCSDINECSLNIHDCDKQTTTCQNIGGGYNCLCLGGYENIPENNKGCRDINECEKVAYNDMSMVCHNTIGSFELQCREGFEKRSGVCEDLDECVANQHSCNTLISTCHNSGGSYKCKCKEGYVNVGNEITCVDVDECGNKKHECDVSTNICLNTDGSYRCECKTGYRQDGSSAKCTDVDECLVTEKYDSIVVCINTEGSFEMSCPKGFHLQEESGRSTCKDMDECLKLVFDTYVRCINLEGEFALTCPIGMYLYEKDGKYMCKEVPSNACKIAAGLLSVIVLVFGTLLIFLWKRTKCRKYAERPRQIDLSFICAGKEIGQNESYILTPKHDESKTSKDLNEYIKINREKECEFEKEFRKLLSKGFEEIRESLSSKELTTQSDKWKVYSANGVNTPHKYIFASFPSETDVEKFWEICMEHSNIIVLIDHVKDSELHFLPSDVKWLKCKELCLKLTKTENKGFLEVNSISVSIEEEFYENMEGSKTQQFEHKDFCVVRVHLKNKDFLTNELFLEIKNHTDLVSYNNSVVGRASSTFVLSRDDIKLASFYTAGCRLFDQMKPYKEDEYSRLYEIVT